MKQCLVAPNQRDAGGMRALFLWSHLIRSARECQPQLQLYSLDRDITTTLDGI